MEPQPPTPPIVPPPPVVEQKPASSNKMFKVVLLVFLVLLLGAVVTYAFQNYQQLPQSDLLPLPEDIPSPTPIDATENWKTFTNEYGYSFKHPDSVQIFTETFDVRAPEEEPDITLVVGLDPKIGFLDNPNLPILKISVLEKTDSRGNKNSMNSFTQDSFEKNSSNPNIDTKVIKEIHETILFGEPAYSFTIEREALNFGSSEFLADTKTYTMNFIEYGDKVYGFAYSEDPTIDQILSTFRFIPQDISLNPLCGEDLIKTLETYKDDEYGFSIDYPKGWVIDSPAYGGKYMGGFARNEDKHYVLGIACAEPQGDWTMVITAINSSFADLEKTADFQSMFKSKETVQVNNQSAIKVLHDNNTISYYFEKSDKSLVINIGGPFNDSPEKPYTENTKRILPTFKFLE